MAADFRDTGPAETVRQPTLFIPHGGGPCFFMDWTPPDAWNQQRAFLARLSAGLPAPPKALLVISAHWEAPVFTFQTHPAPGLLYDYHGFPPHTYRLSWPAPGAPALAERAADLLAAAGIGAAFDGHRGFDHGVFVPLKIAFPEASVPCVQMSLEAGLDPEEHLAAGRALAPLRDDGVLLIGSGNSFHNMQALMAGMSGRARGVTGLDFDAWLSEAVTHPEPRERHRLLIAWASARGARHAHPSEEHLMPLHLVAGAAGADRGRKTLEDHVIGAVQSAYQFG